MNKIGAGTPYYPNNLLESPFIKTISQRWREIVSLSALAISIAGLAITLFENLAWWHAAGFVFLIASSLIGWKTAKDLSSLKELEASTKELQRAHIELQDSEKNLNEALLKAQQGQEALKREISKLEQQNGRLAQFNEEANRLNLGFQQANLSLHDKLDLLAQRKSELESQVETLHGSILQFKGQVQELVNQNVSVAQRLGLFKENASAVQNLNNVIGTNIQNAKQASEDLQQLIRTLKGLNTDNIAFFQRQNEHLAESMEQLTRELERLKTQNPNLQKDAEQLRRLQEELRTTEQSITQKTNDLKELTSLLQQAESRVAAKLEKLSDAK